MGCVVNGAEPECSLLAKAVHIACAVPWQGPDRFRVPLKASFIFFPPEYRKIMRYRHFALFALLSYI